GSLSSQIKHSPGNPGRFSLDMPDQSRARLHKAIGTVLSESNPASALNHLNHALQLDPRCGVKKDKQQLERRLRNDSR
ncbi:hypothetical protein FSI00_022920, partial [Escherichia coli]|nr:hypothetical protein [Escherichia coli]